jgi:hypothetical protein
MNRFTPKAQWVMFSGVNSTAIKTVLNEGMKMSYRSKPYDLENEDDLIEATGMAIAEYIDINYYIRIVGDLVEHTDESIETFRPAEWMAMDGIGEVKDKTFTRAHEALEKADRLFWKLNKQLEEELKYLFKLVILPKNHKARTAFLGEILASESKNTLMERFVKALDGDAIESLANTCSIEESIEKFCQVLKE